MEDIRSLCGALDELYTAERWDDAMAKAKEIWAVAKTEISDRELRLICSKSLFRVSDLYQKECARFL